MYCKDRHEFDQIDDDTLKCRNCSITLTRLDLERAGSSPRKLIEILKKKERDLYIQELES